MGRRAIAIGTGAASGSTGGTPPAPNVATIVRVDVIDGTPDSSGKPQKQVVVTYSPPSPIGTFTGVDVFLDAPDSAGQLSLADGSVPADGTVGAGNFNPTFIGYFPYADTSPPTSQTNQARFLCPAHTNPEYWRVYVLPASSARRASPIEFGLPGASTSEQFFVGPPATATTGREFAPNVINAALVAPAAMGWASNPLITTKDSGNQVFQYAVTWNWPTTDQNYQALAGVNLTLKEGAQGGYIGSAGVGGAGSGTPDQPIYVSPPLPVPVGTTACTLFLESYDQSGRSNTPVSGITPEIDFTVTRALGPAGTEYCSLVTADGVHAFVTAVAAVAADGTALLQVDGYWKKLNVGDVGYDPQFGGAEIVVDKGGGPTTALSVAKGTLAPIENNITQPATLQSWIFYLRSIDVAGKANSIVPGTTPSVTISVGSAVGLLNLGKAATTSFSTQFAVVSGAFTVNAINANVITVGTLKVGNNGSGFPIELDVYDHLGSLIGWIGDDTANSGFVGGWFKQLRIGGANPTASPIVADASGNVTVQGSLVVGTVTAITLTASTITGSTLTINLNGVTTTIANSNVFGGILTSPAIQMITNSTGDNMTLMVPALTFRNGAGHLTAAIGPGAGPGGFVAVYDGSSGSPVTHLSSDGYFNGNGLYLNALGAGVFPAVSTPGFAYQSGSDYSYWNGSAWATVDLSATGGSGFPAGAWTTYTPSTSNLSSTTFDAKYVNTGKTFWVRMHCNGVSNGSNPTFSLPFTPVSNGQCFAGYISLSGAVVAATAYISGGVVVMNLYNNTALAGSTTYDFVFEGVCEHT
jgi:hypothetical protein